MRNESSGRSEGETRSKAVSAQIPDETKRLSPHQDGETSNSADENRSPPGEESEELYEWIGMLTAGLGFFLTPLLTGPIAGYCVLRVNDHNPAMAKVITGVVVLTAIFWVVVALFLIGPNL